MKNIRKSKAPTFTNEGKEKIKVSINFYNPLIDLTNFNNRVTLKTLTILAN